jgi:hypothetical protein
MTIEDDFSNDPAPETIETPESGGNDAPAPAEAEPTSRNAIDRAFDAVDLADNDDDDAGKDGKEQKAKTPADDVEKSKKTDDDAADKSKEADKVKADDKADGDKDGKKADDKEAFVSPPSRFSGDAKKAWMDAPLPVRAEIDRAVKELENGITNYQERFKGIEPFEKLAKDNNVDLADQMQKYVDIDQMLSRDLVGGLNEICKNANVSLKDVAAHVLNQPADATSSQQDAVIRGLQNEIQELKGQLTGVTTSIKNDHEAQLNKSIDDFAAQNPRFNELSEDIALILEMNKANTLAEAYEMADRLNPAPAGNDTDEQEPSPQAEQTRKQYSLSGSPARGSNPKTRKKSETARSAIDDAFAKIGI